MNTPRLDRQTLEFAVGLSERAGTLAAEKFFAGYEDLAPLPLIRQTGQRITGG
ncbi:hypothetical protein ACLQ29_06665 [Micromonospora sp. DT228]|uniref:hypothetical protein n=1 Tax=Micromonospora sp. DT228 TaxID=3393443 RepID=UPI003CF9E1A4